MKEDQEEGKGGRFTFYRRTMGFSFKKLYKNSPLKSNH